MDEAGGGWTKAAARLLVLVERGEGEEGAHAADAVIRAFLVVFPQALHWSPSSIVRTAICFGVVHRALHRVQR